MGLSHINIIGALRSAPRFFRFAFIGAVGFVIDTAILYGVVGLFAAGLYIARAISFLCSATATWYMNRNLTFPDRRSTRLGREWIRFVICNCVGGAVNYLVFAAYVHYGPASPFGPLIGVACGSIAGLGVNYTLSKQLVFVRQGRTGGRPGESPGPQS
jgi:putative flippase GtrA